MGGAVILPVELYCSTSSYDRGRIKGSPLLGMLSMSSEKAFGRAIVTVVAHGLPCAVHPGQYLKTHVTPPVWQRVTSHSQT